MIRNRMLRLLIYGLIITISHNTHIRAGAMASVAQWSNLDPFAVDILPINKPDQIQAWFQDFYRKRIFKLKPNGASKIYTIIEKTGKEVGATAPLLQNAKRKYLNPAGISPEYWGQILNVDAYTLTPQQRDARALTYGFSSNAQYEKALADATIKAFPAYADTMTKKARTEHIKTYQGSTGTLTLGPLIVPTICPQAANYPNSTWWEIISNLIFNKDCMGHENEPDSDGSRVKNEILDELWDDFNPLIEEIRLQTIINAQNAMREKWKAQAAQASKQPATTPSDAPTQEAQSQGSQPEATSQPQELTSQGTLPETASAPETSTQPQSQASEPQSQTTEPQSQASEPESTTPAEATQGTAPTES